MFGPVWHGTTSMARAKIEAAGFKIFIGPARSSDIAHGYEAPHLPIHHLGFGVYFTTSRAIARDFNMRSARGLLTYYLDVPRLETINFGSSNTMMRWWASYGFDPDFARQGEWARVEATKIMTTNLASEFDAVWFKGKGLRRLLDGDQVCVYDPARIYQIDSSLSSGLEIGARVRRLADGMLGIILDRKIAADILERYPVAGESWLRPGTTYVLAVRWKRGGAQSNVLDLDIEPA